MDRFQSLSTFVAVAESGSFSGAARRLGQSLATVSRRVAELESHLQVQLLARTTRKVALTQAGQQFLSSAQQILSALDTAEKRAAGTATAPRGKLVVTAPIVFGRLHVLPVVADFLAIHEEVQIDLKLQDRVVDLIEEQVDIAVRIGDLPDSSLIARKIGRIGQTVCASPAYLRIRRAPEWPSDLQQHQCISFSRAAGPVHWQFVDGERTISQPIISRLTVNTAEAALDAAIAGGGITRLFSYQAAAAIGEGRLQPILQKFAPPTVPASLVYVSGTMMTAKLRAFIDFATPRLVRTLPAAK